MIHRLAILIGTIAAAAVLAIGFAASGLGPAAAPANAGQLTVAQQPDVTEQQTIAAQDTEPAAAKPITKVKTKTIYVKPAPKPKVVHVTKREPAPAAKRPKIKVVRVNKDRPAERADDRDDDDDHEDEDKHEDEDREGHEDEDKHEDEDH